MDQLLEVVLLLNKMHRVPNIPIPVNFLPYRDKLNAISADPLWLQIAWQVITNTCREFALLGNHCAILQMLALKLLYSHTMPQGHPRQ